MPIFIATASGNIHQRYRAGFPEGPSILKRYSQVFNYVEINSSFYKNHKQQTYKKWKDSVPDDFKFITKLPKQITHQQKFKTNNILEITAALEGMEGLGDKWGGLLVQTPPQLEFEPQTHPQFFHTLRQYYTRPLFLEPGNLSWAAPDAINLMTKYKITKVLADPERCSIPAQVDLDDLYFRLHGSPKIYKSSYSLKFLEQLAKDITAPRNLNKNIWITFDNTQLGFSTENALKLKEILAQLSVDAGVFTGDLLPPELS